MLSWSYGHRQLTCPAVCHCQTDPLALLAYVGYRVHQANGWPVRDGLLTTAYVFLTIRLGSWFSNRWRNGLIPVGRLNAKTWPNEIALVTGGAQGIGKALCDQLASKGCKVAAIDVMDFKPSHRESTA